MNQSENIHLTKNLFKYILLVLFFLAQIAKSQTLPVGTPDLEDYYRRQQLIGAVDSNISFTLKPLYPTKFRQPFNIFDPDGKLENDNWSRIEKKEFANGKGVFEILPLNWTQQFNSNHPYGWNDGMMIPAKGYQTLISGGFFLKYGPLSIQFYPEYVYAANTSFAGFASGHNDFDLSTYYQSGEHKFIDEPERFGNTSFSKFGLGQSSVRLTFGPVSFGLSNENLWWGPGIRNSLILSNNAPGFKHVTVNTVRPISTPIGTFEAQIIGAHLDNSPYPSLLTTTTSTGENLVPYKVDLWRYYAGLNFNYHPKWIPGLFFGLIRTFNSYHTDVKTLQNYIPFFIPYTKVSIGDGNTGDDIPRDQVTSLSARWLFSKAHAEVYFEYGLNDNSYNLNDFFGSPQHSRAYIFGLRKLIPLNDKSGGAILFSGEVTQLSQTIDRSIRGAGTWYVHYQIQQGQTNFGQVLGAGTGPGGNLQSADLSWVKGLKKLGIMFERYEHDVDFSDEVYTPINGHDRKWVDFGLGFIGNWNYKNLLISAKMEGVESLNYEWVLKDYNPGNYYVPHNGVFNLHLQIGTSYRF